MELNKELLGQTANSLFEEAKTQKNILSGLRGAEVAKETYLDKIRGNSVPPRPSKESLKWLVVRGWSGWGGGEEGKRGREPGRAGILQEPCWEPINRAEPNV